MFVFVLLCITCGHSSLEEEKVYYFAIIVLKMHCYFKYSVTLPHDAVG